MSGKSGEVGVGQNPSAASSPDVCLCVCLSPPPLSLPGLFVFLHLSTLCDSPCLCPSLPVSVWHSAHCPLSSLGRGLLGRPGCRDSELLRQCRGSEQVLWGLPCSWVQVPAHTWGHSEELAKLVRGRILQEQARLVWVERGSGPAGGSGSSEA